MTGGQYMNKTLEAIISKTTADLTCSPEEKLDIQHELRDHLYSAFENYLNEGYSKEDAIKRVLSDFGHTETVSIQYQQVVNPLFGWLRKLAWIGFILYACVILWKVLISRIIIRVLAHLGVIDPFYLKFVVTNTSNLVEKQFFDFSMWAYNVNLIPFKSIVFYASGEHVNFDIALNNLIGNFIMLLPLGLLLPFMFKKCQSLITITTIAFCTSFAIEILQFTLQIGRADIDDLILNTLGAIFGFLIAKGIFQVLTWKVKWKHSNYVRN